MQHLHAIQNFIDHGIRNTDFLKLAVKAAKYCKNNPDITLYNTILYTPGPRDSPHRVGAGSGTGPLDFESPGPVPDP